MDDPSVIEFEKSILICSENKENFMPGMLRQGVNLFGRCTKPECAKKFNVKLGLGLFHIGKPMKEF